MTKLVVKVGRQALLWEDGETVWETVFTEPNVKNFIVECHDDQGNVTGTLQGYDPGEEVEA